MGNFSVYLTIMSSVLFFGYSLSLSTNGYKSICDKAVKFKELLKMEMDASEGIRKTNISLIKNYAVEKFDSNTPTFDAPFTIPNVRCRLVFKSIRKQEQDLFKICFPK